MLSVLYSSPPCSFPDTCQRRWDAAQDGLRHCLCVSRGPQDCCNVLGACSAAPRCLQKAVSQMAEPLPPRVQPPEHSNCAPCHCSCVWKRRKAGNIRFEPIRDNLPIAFETGNICAQNDHGRATLYALTMSWETGGFPVATKSRLSQLEICSGLSFQTCDGKLQCPAVIKRAGLCPQPHC